MVTDAESKPPGEPRYSRRQEVSRGQDTRSTRTQLGTGYGLSSCHPSHPALRVFSRMSCQASSGSGNGRGLAAPGSCGSSIARMMSAAVQLRFPVTRVCTFNGRPGPGFSYDRPPEEGDRLCGIAVGRQTAEGGQSRWPGNRPPKRDERRHTPFVSWPTPVSRFAICWQKERRDPRDRGRSSSSKPRIPVATWMPPPS
jgi:hypothetical protein